MTRHRLLLVAVLGAMPAASFAHGGATPAAAPSGAVAPSGPRGADDFEAKEGDQAAAKPVETSVQLRVPMFSDLFASVPVATIGGEAITLEELVDALAMKHEDGSAGEGGATKKNYGAVLDRIIDARAFVLEARDMGLGEIASVASDVERFKVATQREMLKSKATKGVSFDPDVVGSIYKEAARKWKMRSVLFAKEEDAKALRDAIRKDGVFDELAKQAVADGKAKGGEAGWALPVDMLPQVLETVRNMAAGSVSEPVSVPGGFAVISVEEVAVHDNPEMRRDIEADSRKTKRAEKLREYYKSLVKKHATVDTKLVDRLNLEAKKPGFTALEKDKRVVARIKGEKPITVGQLATEVGKKFYHGIESGIRDKTLNREKWPTLESMLFRRLLTKEAALQKVAETPEFKKRLTEFTNSQLFGTYIEKVILPAVKVTEGEVQAHYDQNRGEYMYPQLLKLDGIAFVDAKDAQAALQKLTAGTDLKWLKQNAERQVDPAARALALEGKTVTARSLPPDLAAALSGTKSGDSRLYTAGEHHYVIHVIDAKPAREQPYAEARKGITEMLFAKKVNAAIDEQAKKLREAHEVRVFLSMGDR